MPSHKQQPSVTATADSIPDKTEQTWDEKLELTESNLRHWLLGPVERQRQILNEVKQRMRNEGVSDELIARCIHYESLPSENRKRETLKLVTNSKTGRLHDTFTLQQAGRLSDAEIEGIRTEHNGLLPPYYYVTNIRRVLDDRQNSREYLVYSLLFEGISAGGKREGHINAEANMRINDSAIVGYHLVPRITWETIKDKDGEEKRVATFDSIRTPIIDDASTRVYEIPFSKEAVEALMKHTRNGQVALGIDHLSKNKHYAIKDVNEFLTDDLPALIERYEKPPATYNFNVQPEKLATYLQLDEAAKQEHQYQ
jgi:hypothetical protein